MKQQPVPQFIKRMHQLNRWSIFPAGYWTERDGSFVVFDGKSRPLCRKRPTGETEIVEMDERICFCEEHRFYSASEHPADSSDVREKIIGITDRLELHDEIIYRRKYLSKAFRKQRGKSLHWIGAR